MARRLLLVFGVLALAGCSNMCGAASSQASQASPQATATLAAAVADASCQAESTSRSLNSNTPTSYTITNHTSVVLTLFWLNFQGQRVRYFDLAPAETKNQGTYVTHPWVAADPNGTCIHLFLVVQPVHITIG
jgi:hypothetical protein